ncbi:MAG TPA: DMT family transporter [Firmicutes bacterium]|nr:DMT family transporter [Bacillota bacterium]
MKNNRLCWAADISLLLVAALWGFTFVIIKEALAELPPFTFNAVRFILASLFMCLAFPRRLASLGKEGLKAGILIGLALLAGYSLQTLGMVYSTASNAGFLTGLTVVFVPLLTMVVTRSLPESGVLAGVAFAVLGLGLLTLGDSFLFNYGDLLLLLCAVAFATHLILVGHYGRKFDATALTAVQILTAAAGSSLLAFGLETFPLLPPRFSPPVWQALLITSLLATCLAYFVLMYMQQYTTPVRMAIVLTGEPAFAALFACLLLKETLGPRALAGGGFVLLGMLTVELAPLLKDNARQRLEDRAR